ncbi:MAG TPA: arginine--tRNA ligase, partial [Methylophilus sp.]|nr:arginine--tRNA ligase [Methylophilus sp.]HSI46205.1 arginine--tRNA ligase [Methylophilus sp.]
MKQTITELILQAVTPLVEDTSSLNIILERPKSAEHGDFASNIAMQLAKPLKQNPRAIAQTIIDSLPANSVISKVEIAGAGFINFFLSAQSKQDIVKSIFQAGATFGRNTSGQLEKVQVEFVSANPTGPLHVGH